MFIRKIKQLQLSLEHKTRNVIKACLKRVSHLLTKKKKKKEAVEATTGAIIPYFRVLVAVEIDMV
jgi:hypothetical protein